MSMESWSGWTMRACWPFTTSSSARRTAFWRASALMMLGFCSGCATPVAFTDKGMDRYDKNTRIAIDERPDGFTVSIYYSRYQMIPESSAVATACRQQALAAAWDIARKRGKKIQQINEQEVKISMGRNGVTGITSCTASAPAYYQ